MPKSLRMKLDLRDSSDFHVPMSKRRVGVVSGTDAVYTISPTALTGFTGDISLSVTGLPTGASSEISDSNIAYYESSTVTVSTSGVTGGTYNFLIGAELAGAGNYDWLLVDYADRIAFWLNAGVWYGGVKGIPDFPVGVTVSTLGTNAATNTTLIQNAINSCPANHAAYLSQTGTFPVNALTMKSRVVVRGAGIGLTILTRTGSYSTIGASISYPYYNVVTNISSGYTKGSTSIMVASSSGFTVGDLVLIDQKNNPDYANAGGDTPNGDFCGYCGRYGDDSDDPDARDQRETCLITNINGATITFDRGLNCTFSATYVPQLVRVGTPVIYAGIEDLTLSCISDSASLGDDNVSLQASAYCWLKNVESINAGRHSVAFSFNCYGCEVRRSYIHESHAWGPDQGYGVWLYYGTTNCLIEDNEFHYLHAPVALEAGATGNVVAYNYSNQVHYIDPDWRISDYTTHGAHNMLNLFEGNVGGKIMADYTHGSGSHQMFFRNYITRENPGESNTLRVQAIEFYEWNYYMGVVGNIFGTPGMSGVFEKYHTESDTPTIWTTSGNVYPKILSTIIREGNYDYIRNALEWYSGGGARGIPESLYLTAKPSWWGATAWPPYTPERVGFNPASLNTIPAQVRWEAR